MTAQSPILEALMNFFTAEDWAFSQVEGKPILSMGFKGKNGQWNCFAKAREAEAQFVFYSVCPVNAPEEKRLAVAEFLTRANYGLVIGNFEMDFDDGEIHYKTSIDLKGSHFQSVLIKQLVYANVLALDKYLPGIMALIYTDISPLTAIAQVES